MKQFVLTALAFVCSLNINAHTIVRKGDLNGGKFYVTSQEKLFSGCTMRMCRFVKDNNVSYELELDLTDRADHVCQGNLFTINFQDGSNIELSNMQDAKAEIKREEHIETYYQSYTGFARCYNPWHGFYSVPVTRYYPQHVPVVTTTSFTRVYYPITQEQIDQVINGKVKAVSIVTDNSIITKKARPLSKAIATLYAVVNP